MHTVKLDLISGRVLINSIPITTNDKGELSTPIKELCSPPTTTKEGGLRFQLLSKVSILGKPAEGVIEIRSEKLCAIAFLFEKIEFFKKTILESKTIKSCEKSSKVKFLSDHPTTAFSPPREWGQAIFFYDAKQGDLSLNIEFLPTQSSTII